MGKRLRTVFFVGNQAVAEGVPAAFLGVPFIIDETGEPIRWLNEYFFARRNGDWSPPAPAQGKQVELAGQSVVRTSLNYLRNRAYQLDVFRRWCAAADVPFSQVTETHLEQFASYLESCSKLGLDQAKNNENGLQLQSINQYLLSAIDLLSFGAKCGFRESLPLRMRRVRSRRGKATLQPAILRRPDPKEITTWYTEEEIGKFIEEFETASLKLASRLLYGMGLRLNECLSLKTTDFPSLQDFRRDRAYRKIRVVGKFGKKRRVDIDESLLKSVHRYCEFDRKLLQAKSRQQTSVLLLGFGDDGRTGPLKARLVQKAFVGTRKKAGFTALSPHLLRHHHAAHFVLRAWKLRSATTDHAFRSYDKKALEVLLAPDLLRLMQNLGHADLNVTCEYLNAITYLLGSDIPEAYEAELDTSEPEGDDE